MSGLVGFLQAFQQRLIQKNEKEPNMTHQATLEKMQQLRLHGMTTAFRASLELPLKTNGKEQFTIDEFVALLIDAEWEERENRKLSRLIKNADFRYKACFEQIDFGQNRKLDKNLVLRLSACQWIEKAENVLISGATGVGKSFLACALGHQACLQGFKCLYFNSMKLFSRLKFAKADGTYGKEMQKIQKQHLLILDDFGLHPMDEQSKFILLELMEDRYGEKSTIIASQLPPDKWHAMLNNPTLADAICDRLIHNAFKINLHGDSMRKTKKTDSGLNFPKDSKK